MGNSLNVKKDIRMGLSPSLEKNRVNEIKIPETDKLLAPKRKDIRIATPKWRRLLGRSMNGKKYSRKKLLFKRHLKKKSSGEGDSISRRQVSKIRWNIPERTFIPAEDSNEEVSESDSYNSSDDYDICRQKWKEERKVHHGMSDNSIGPARSKSWMKSMIHHLRAPRCYSNYAARRDFQGLHGHRSSRAHLQNFDLRRRNFALVFSSDEKEKHPKTHDLEHGNKSFSHLGIDSKGSSHSKLSRGSRESRESKGSRCSRESRKSKGSKCSRESRESIGSRCSRESRKSKGSICSRGSRRSRGSKCSRGSRELRVRECPVSHHKQLFGILKRSGSERSQSSSHRSNNNSLLNIPASTYIRTEYCDPTVTHSDKDCRRNQSPSRSRRSEHKYNRCDTNNQHALHSSASTHNDSKVTYSDKKESDQDKKHVLESNMSWSPGPMPNVNPQVYWPGAYQMPVCPNPVANQVYQLVPCWLPASGTGGSQAPGAPYPPGASRGGQPGPSGPPNVNAPGATYGIAPTCGPGPPGTCHGNAPGSCGDPTCGFALQTNASSCLQAQCALPNWPSDFLNHTYPESNCIPSRTRGTLTESKCTYCSSKSRFSSLLRRRHPRNNHASRHGDGKRRVSISRRSSKAKNGLSRNSTGSKRICTCFQENIDQPPKLSVCDQSMCPTLNTSRSRSYNLSQENNKVTPCTIACEESTGPSCNNTGSRRSSNISEENSKVPPSTTMCDESTCPSWNRIGSCKGGDLCQENDKVTPSTIECEESTGPSCNSTGSRRSGILPQQNNEKFSCATNYNRSTCPSRKVTQSKKPCVTFRENLSECIRPFDDSLSNQVHKTMAGNTREVRDNSPTTNYDTRRQYIFRPRNTNISPSKTNETTRNVRRRRVSFDFRKDDDQPRLNNKQPDYKRNVGCVKNQDMCRENDCEGPCVMYVVEGPAPMGGGGIHTMPPFSLGGLQTDSVCRPMLAMVLPGAEEAEICQMAGFPMLLGAPGTIGGVGAEGSYSGMPRCLPFPYSSASEPSPESFHPMKPQNVPIMDFLRGAPEIANCAPELPSQKSIQSQTEAFASRPRKPPQLNCQALSRTPLCPRPTASPAAKRPSSPSRPYAPRASAQTQPFLAASNRGSRGRARRAFPRTQQQPWKTMWGSPYNYPPSQATATTKSTTTTAGGLWTANTSAASQPLEPTQPCHMARPRSSTLTQLLRALAASQGDRVQPLSAAQVVPFSEDDSPPRPSLHSTLSPINSPNPSNKRMARILKCLATKTSSSTDTSVKPPTKDCGV